MKIYPVVSNVVNIELEDGSLFELHEGTNGLSIKTLKGELTARELNVMTLGFDMVWRGSTINLTVEGP